MPPDIPIILILGPTAGGKTRLAIDLANELGRSGDFTSGGGGECICADSMQVYRGMDIGTAKPTAEEQQQATHHLIDLVDPADESFSVDRWLELAEQTIADIRSRNKHPIIVGGTNLYIQALLFGLFDGPPPEENLRSRLQQLSDDELRERLTKVDPVAAARIHRNDRKRTIRAIEVYETTGERLSDLQTQWEHQPPRGDVIIIGLNYAVDTINRRINARVKHMIDAGFVDEVRRLHERDAFGQQSREALGYKQILAHLRGECTLAEAVEQIKIRTRRYAKQQRTWLRRFQALPRSVWIDADAMTPQQLAEAALRGVHDETQGQ